MKSRCVFNALRVRAEPRPVPAIAVPAAPCADHGCGTPLCVLMEMYGLGTFKRLPLHNAFLSSFIPLESIGEGPCVH